MISKTSAKYLAAISLSAVVFTAVPPAFASASSPSTDAQIQKTEAQFQSAVPDSFGRNAAPQLVAVRSANAKVNTNGTANCARTGACATDRLATQGYRDCLRWSAHLRNDQPQRCLKEDE